MLTPTPTDAPALVDLARITLALGRVNRITFHPDGTTPESDTDHTVMLGLVACAFAQRHLPQLNLGRVAEYALVHDLAEVYAGDTPTLRITADQQAAKQAREAAATARLHREFGDRLPWLPATLARYERLAEPEARYVKAIDKLLPKLTHALNRCVTLHRQRPRVGRDELVGRYDRQVQELMVYASDFPPLFDLYAELAGMVLGVLAPAPAAPAAPAGPPEPEGPAFAALAPPGGPGASTPAPVGAHVGVGGGNGVGDETRRRL